MFRSLVSHLRLLGPLPKMTGQIWTVGPVITGWLRSDSRPDASLFRVRLNDVPASVRVSFEPTAAFGEPHFYEFKAELESGAICTEGATVTVAYGFRKSQLAGSPWHLGQEAKNDFPYAFLHIPKTAGTSLRMALEAALGPSRVFPCQEYLQRRGGRYLSAQEASGALAGVPQGIELIQGHFRLHQLRSLAPTAKIIAVFREPVDRSVSLIKHKMAASGDTDAPEEYLIKKYLRGGAVNGQVRALCQGGGTDCGPESLEQAIAALNQIDVFGVSEEYDSALARVSEMIGKPLKNSSLNRSRVQKRGFSESFISKVREANQLDIEFYKSVKMKLRLEL